MPKQSLIAYKMCIKYISDLQHAVRRFLRLFVVRSEIRKNQCLTRILDLVINRTVLTLTSDNSSPTIVVK